MGLLFVQTRCNIMLLHTYASKLLLTLGAHAQRGLQYALYIIILRPYTFEICTFHFRMSLLTYKSDPYGQKEHVPKKLHIA